MGKENALLQVQNLKKYFKTAKGQLHAVDDITFSLGAREDSGRGGRIRMREIHVGKNDPQSSSGHFRRSDF